MSPRKTSPTPEKRKIRTQPNPPASPSKLAHEALPAGLYLVATPIGNANDITLRALDILARADVVAGEDTRVTAPLLKRHNINALSLVSYHEHNADKMRPWVIERIKEGKSVALVSDAGTPLVSDPGFKLVRDIADQGLAVTALPGANAAITALILSGLPSDRFLFAGFLSSKESARRREAAELAPIKATLILYESAQRLAASLNDLLIELGDRPAAVARELTKMFEEVRRGSLSQLAGYYAEHGPPKGEIVIVVGAPLEESGGGAELAISLDEALTAAMTKHSVRDAAAIVSAELRLPKRDVYARALRLAQEQHD